MSRIKRYDRNAADVSSTPEGGVSLERQRGAGYLASIELEHAINTAIALGRPLLVSGEPGCGKTELGFSIARKLGLPNVHFFAVKSDSEGSNLFYEYDAVRRFHAAQLAGKGAAADAEGSDPRQFIRYQALGLAILQATPRELVAHLVSDVTQLPPSPSRSVVVIDEIDKAPRDFPNDLLNEIDQFWFRVPELAGWVGAPHQPETPRQAMKSEFRPIVVVTSNLERQLPDAFLRRCVFHHIEHPANPDLQRQILQNHLEKFSMAYADTDLGEAIALVGWARNQSMEKPPGLAELLEFVRAITARRSEVAQMRFNERAISCISALGKTTRDQRLLLDRLAVPTST